MGATTFGVIWSRAKCSPSTPLSLLVLLRQKGRFQTRLSNFEHSSAKRTLQKAPKNGVEQRPGTDRDRLTNPAINRRYSRP
jgi:hypothetical protein